MRRRGFIRMTGLAVLAMCLPVPKIRPGIDPARLKIVLRSVLHWNSRATVVYGCYRDRAGVDWEWADLWDGDITAEQIELSRKNMILAMERARGRGLLI